MDYEIQSKLSAEEFNKKYKLSNTFAAKLKLSEKQKNSNSIAGKPKVLGIEIFKRFFSNPIVVISTFIFLGIIITAFIVKLSSPYSPGKDITTLWKQNGYEITGSSINYYGELPPTFAPFKTFVGANNAIIKDIQKLSNPNENPFYDFTKSYIVEGVTYKIAEDSTRTNPIYFINIYKLWEAKTIESYMHNKLEPNLIGKTLTIAEIKTEYADAMQTWFNEAKNAVSQIKLKTWFGTTREGSDIWTTVWAGTLESLWLALVVATIETIIGVFVGAILGFYAGKWIDTIFSRVIEIFQAPPSIIWLLMFVSIWGTSAPVLIAGLLFVGWTYPIAATRLFVITVKDEEYITASKSIGASPMRQIFNHALPAVVGKIAQNYVRRIPSIIISVASLAFLGFFSDPNSYNLGKIMIENTDLVETNPWVMILPATILLLLSLSLQFVALGLHDALDPKVIKIKN